MADRLSEAKAIYANLRPWLLRYRGGMPAGVLAAIVQHESGGNMASRGDPSLGEVGYFQVTADLPPQIGWPSDARYDPESNVFLGCLEYQIRAIQMKLHAPLVVALGTEDSWKLARLAFAVGLGGTQKLLDAATGGAAIYSGQGFSAIRAYANRTGGQSLGTQSAATVLARVNDVDVQWAVGAMVAPLFYGAPEKVPSPGSKPYSLPAAVSPFMSSTLKELILLAVLAAGGVAAASLVR